jgi:hypothetical protein
VRRQLCGYLLIEYARNHQAHDLALAHRQPLVALSKLGEVALVLTHDVVASQSPVDRIQQVAVGNSTAPDFIVFTVIGMSP